MAGWDQAIEAHLRVARQINPTDKIAKLAQAAGFAIGAAGNGAANHDDVDRYLSAVASIMGEVAVISARMKITNKARELGLSG